jgi:type I restriction enzyme R subunit
MTPGARARVQINWLLEATGRPVCDDKATNIHVGKGIAIREFEFFDGPGHVDYLLKTCAKAVGGIEIKKQGAALGLP